MNIFAVALAAAATTLIATQIAPISNLGNTPVASASHTRSTDVIIGEGDFNQVRPEYRTDPATEHANHTLRLRYIESMLRGRDVSDMPEELRAERARNLDRLHAYWNRAEYPVNYDHPKAWEPCFIDKKGAICAVGYLVEQTLGRDVAENINKRYQYATIKQIDAPELASWIERSGLTKAEVVTIQGPSIEEMSPSPSQSRISARGRRSRMPARTQEPLTNVQIATATKEPAVIDKSLPVQLDNAIQVIQEPVTPLSVEQAPAVEMQAAPATQVQAPTTVIAPSTGASID